MPVRVPKSETRTLDQLREHYDIERELADLLRRASKAERRGLYPLLYDERNRRLPHHPGLQRRLDATLQAEHVATQMVLLQPFLRRARTFMEVGPGDCALSLEVSKRADKVYAVDVSAEVTSSLAYPDNFRLILSDGVSIPVPDGTIDLAFSNALMEHLHPEDAREQLVNIHKALAPGGIYVCLTPHRFSGPHDISKYFDDIATGFHLKEYTNGEVAALLQAAGFSSLCALIRPKRRVIGLPMRPVVCLERTLSRLPHPTRRWLASGRPFSTILGVRVAAVKERAG